MERAKRTVVQIASTPDSHIQCLPFLHRSFLLPLLSFTSSLYSLSLSLRRRLHLSGLLRQHRLPVPVISVGNLTWGGNGKTPMVEFIARFLDEAGIPPLILTRGYAGGDEAKMLQRHLEQTSAKIGVGANRSAVARSILDRYGHMDPLNLLQFEKKISSDKSASGPENEKVGAVILDDGMQVCDAQLKIVEYAVQKVSSSILIYFTKLAPSYFFDVKKPLLKLPLSMVQNVIALCVSAIGFPDAFVQAIKKIGPLHVDRVDFSDHHIIEAEDVRVIRKRLQELQDGFRVKAIMIVTEKDYDRDPVVLRGLDNIMVLVLCSSVKIISSRNRSEENFKMELTKLLARKHGADL